MRRRIRGVQPARVRGDSKPVSFGDLEFHFDPKSKFDPQPQYDAKPKFHPSAKFDPKPHVDSGS
jgi:hypothetical protein